MIIFFFSLNVQTLKWCGGPFGNFEKGNIEFFEKTFLRKVIILKEVYFENKFVIELNKKKQNLLNENKKNLLTVSTKLYLPTNLFILLKSL